MTREELRQANYEELYQELRKEERLRDGYLALATDTLRSTSSERKAASRAARAAKGRIRTLIRQLETNGWPPF